jgi:hypothetical protein
VFRTLCFRSAIVGAVGPLALIPVSLWLGLRSPRPTLDIYMRWETIFQYLWPTSVMLMAGSGVKPLSVEYVCLLLVAGAANVLLFVLVAAIGGGLYLVLQKVARGMH